jgi:hypothetical protein
MIRPPGQCNRVTAMTIKRLPGVFVLVSVRGWLPLEALEFGFC